ncbi:MAG: bifunctional UDP-N-acetylglucosamine diphosphorylase/glucosamine-1-phosphate N-acetyltransferase GlmU [Pseudomonadota bacterium]
MALSPHSDTLAIILAAGLGTRMKSDMPKCLHEVGGQALVCHALSAAMAVSGDRAVVVGPDMPTLEKAVREFDPEAVSVVQHDRLGTGHAAQIGLANARSHHAIVIVTFGDTPFVQAETIERAIVEVRNGANVAVLGFRAEDPTGYGRLLVENGRLVAIREEAVASETEREVSFCNSGVMAFNAESLKEILPKIENSNPKGEFYLTDAVEIANAMDGTAVAVEGEESEFIGINSKRHLAQAEAIFQSKRRDELMDAGVTMVAPETVFLAADTVFGRDCVIEPHCVFGRGVRVGDRCQIKAFSHLEEAVLENDITIGPYARLRPKAHLKSGARVGNFVEIKASTLHEGAKANHLSYIGDADVGPAANIGAGTITCNYDGFVKSKTTIGAGAFIGSNSALVAPVEIGEKAIVAAGSAISKDVGDNALAFGRAKQSDDKPGKGMGSKSKP